MATIRKSIEIGAPIAEVFGYVADPANALSWMVGFDEFVPVGSPTAGKGARVRASGRVLGIRVTSYLEIVEFVENDRIVSVTTEGPVRSVSVWAFAPSPGGTLVTFRGEYRVHGLPVPALGDHLLAHEVASHTTLSLRHLKRVLEARRRERREAPVEGDVETPGERC